MSRYQDPRRSDVICWPGAIVLGRGGLELGRVDHVYVDRASGRPTFLAIRASQDRSALVPVELVAARGDRLESDLTLDGLADAPGPAADGVLTPALESRVRRRFDVP